MIKGTLNFGTSEPKISKRFQGRYPADIWVQIFRYLYLSQLSKVSMTCKAFNSVVSSLDVWSTMFATACGPKAHLRALAGIPKSKSYMIFMCSSSLHVCERCFARSDYFAGALYKLPHPIPVLLPRRSTDSITYLGERFDPSWTIGLCLSCRQNHLLTHDAPYPYQLKQISLTTIFQRYPYSNQVPELNTQGFDSLIDERVAISQIRQHFGGEVGIQSAGVSTFESDERTETRIRWYQLQ